MTTVRVEKKEGHIVSVMANGHTDYAEEGSDIICAALSAIIQTAVMGLEKVAEIKDFTYYFADTEGYMEVKLGDLDTEEKHDADVILDTMLCGISDLAEGCSRFIKLEVK